MNPKKIFEIEGLAGQKLKGKIKVNGAKNAALKAMAAALLFDSPVTLENVPDTEDVKTMSLILEKLGAKVETREKKGSKEVVIDPSKMSIDPAGVKTGNIDAELAKSMRASVVLTGPLLGRIKKASFPSPGGCVIGARPIDLFLTAYAKMGAKVNLKGNIFEIDARTGLKGAEIFFDFQSVGGTETLMMAAVLAEGKTVLKNCAMEPEIQSVAEWLNSCGANINGAGTPTIEIEGRNGKLLSPDHAYVTVPDRIEAGSFLILGAACAEDLVIEDCRPEHLESVINLLRNSGAKIECSKNSIRVKAAAGPFKPFNVRTHEYPGFPTDLQSPIVAFLTQASGQSQLFETIFEGRFKFAEELTRMGADITIMNPREILIKGPSDLKELPDAEELTAHDIRAGFAVVMAALMGKGKFIVNNIHLIDRGYERLEEKLSGVGASIRRISN